VVLDPPDDMDHLVDLYDSVLKDIVDEHPPLKTKEMPRRPSLHGTTRTYKLQRDKRYSVDQVRFVCSL